MKKLFILAVLTTLVAFQSFAVDKNARKLKVAAKNSVENQIASLVTYPELMKQGGHEGIVVVSFTVQDDKRVSQVTVHTANKELNDSIIRQLTGKKLKVTEEVAEQPQTVRLHFSLQ